MCKRLYAVKTNRKHLSKISLFFLYLENCKTDFKNSLHTEISIKNLTKKQNKKWVFGRSRSRRRRRRA